MRNTVIIVPPPTPGSGCSSCEARGTCQPAAHPVDAPPPLKCSVSVASAAYFLLPAVLATAGALLGGPGGAGQLIGGVAGIGAGMLAGIGLGRLMSRPESGSRRQAT